MRETGVEDATRRTRLANERTYLAWWRTGLAALAVGVGIGKLLPDHTSTSINWAYEVVGVAFSLLGIAFIAVGLQRARAVEEALDHGSFAPLNPTLLTALVIAGILLGLGAIGLVIFG